MGDFTLFAPPRVIAPTTGGGGGTGVVSGPYLAYLRAPEFSSQRFLVFALYGLSDTDTVEWSDDSAGSFTFDPGAGGVNDTVYVGHLIESPLTFTVTAIVNGVPLDPATFEIT